MTITEIVLQESEFKSIVESLNRFAEEINPKIGNIQFLPPEQRVLREKGEKMKELADVLNRLSSETAFYIIKRVESKH